MAEYEVDRQSHSYMLGVAEYERDKFKAERNALVKDLAEAVRLLDALLGLEMDSGGDALAFIERYRASVGDKT